MNLKNRKTYFMYYTMLLFFTCQRKVEMKSFQNPRFSKPCQNIVEDGRCICKFGYKSCVFEDKSGNPDPYDDYKNCVKYERTDSCCPYGWSYNEYSVDVNCIGPNETMAGYGALNKKKEKRCFWASNPSCRKQSMIGNKLIIDHICQKQDIPCNGRCYVKGNIVCHAQQKCMSQYMWENGCDDAKTTIVTSGKDKDDSKLKISTGWIICFALLGAFFFFLTCCVLHAVFTCRRYRAVQREDDINIRMKTKKEEGCFWWTIGHTGKYCSGKMQKQINDHHELKGAFVETNANYGYAEQDDDIEVVDYNDYYGDAK